MVYRFGLHFDLKMIRKNVLPGLFDDVTIL